MIKDIHREDFQNPDAPVAPLGGQPESFEVRRLDAATNDITGPVVVGGRAMADCFRYYDSVQAGVCDPNAYGNPPAANDGDADDMHIPTRPW